MINTDRSWLCKLTCIFSKPFPQKCNSWEIPAHKDLSVDLFLHMLVYNSTMVSWLFGEVLCPLKTMLNSSIYGCLPLRGQALGGQSQVHCVHPTTSFGITSTTQKVVHKYLMNHSLKGASRVTRGGVAVAAWHSLGLWGEGGHPHREGTGGWLVIRVDVHPMNKYSKDNSKQFFHCWRKGYTYEKGEKKLNFTYIYIYPSSVLWRDEELLTTQKQSAHLAPRS